LITSANGLRRRARRSTGFWASRTCRSRQVPSLPRVYILSTKGDLQLNEHYYSDYKSKFLTHYKSVFDSTHDSELAVNFATFKHDQAGEDERNAVSEIMRGLSTLGLSELAPRDLAKLLPLNPLEGAITVMAEVRAYYQGLPIRRPCGCATVDVCSAVAYKRFSDNVPLSVDREILRGVDNGIGPALFRGLGLGGDSGPQKCKELLQEASLSHDRSLPVSHPDSAAEHGIDSQLTPDASRAPSQRLATSSPSIEHC
jgi:hypothetical protein